MRNRDALQRQERHVRRRRANVVWMKRARALIGTTSCLGLVAICVPAGFASVMLGIKLAADLDVPVALSFVVAFVVFTTCVLAGTFGSIWLWRRVIGPLEHAVESAEDKSWEAVEQFEEVEHRLKETPRVEGADAGLSLATADDDAEGALSMPEENGAVSLVERADHSEQG